MTRVASAVPRTLLHSLATMRPGAPAAAAGECAATLTCPSACPCRYFPRAQLAIYSFNNGLEEGYLLQGAQVWNCQCMAANPD